MCVVLHIIKHFDRSRIVCQRCPHVHGMADSLGLALKGCHLFFKSWLLVHALRHFLRLAGQQDACKCPKAHKPKHCEVESVSTLSHVPVFTVFESLCSLLVMTQLSALELCNERNVETLVSSLPGGCCALAARGLLKAVAAV